MATYIRVQADMSCLIVGTVLWVVHFMTLAWEEDSHLVRVWKAGVVSTRVFVQLRWGCL